MCVFYPVNVPGARAAFYGGAFEAGRSLVVIAEIVARLVCAFRGVFDLQKRFVVQRIALGKVVIEEFYLALQGIGIEALLFAPAYEDRKARGAPLAKPLIIAVFAAGGAEVGFLLDVCKNAAGEVDSESG